MTLVSSLSRCNSSAHKVRRTALIVAPHARQSVVTCAMRLSPINSGTCLADVACTSGRGKSAGRVSNSETPCSLDTHQSSAS